MQNSTSFPVYNFTLFGEVPEWTRIIYFTYLFLVYALGIPGNLITAIIYWRTRPKSACDWLILSMSLADLFVCFWVPWLYFRTEYPLEISFMSSSICGLETSLQLSAMMASLGMLDVIALDRYVKICHTRLKSLTPTASRNLCIFLILLAVALSVAPGRDAEMNMNASCRIYHDWGFTSHMRGYYTMFFTFYALSFCIISFTYGNIIITIGRKVRRKQRLIQNDGLRSQDPATAANGNCDTREAVENETCGQVNDPGSRSRWKGACCRLFSAKAKAKTKAESVYAEEQGEPEYEMRLQHEKRIQNPEGNQSEAIVDLHRGGHTDVETSENCKLLPVPKPGAPSCQILPKNAGKGDNLVSNCYHPQDYLPCTTNEIRGDTAEYLIKHSNSDIQDNVSPDVPREPDCDTHSHILQRIAEPVGNTDGHENCLTSKPPADNGVYERAVLDLHANSHDNYQQPNDYNAPGTDTYDVPGYLDHPGNKLRSSVSPGSELQMHQGAYPTDMRSSEIQETERHDQIDLCNENEAAVLLCGYNRLESPQNHVNVCGVTSDDSIDVLGEGDDKHLIKESRKLGQVDREDQNKSGKLVESHGRSNSGSCSMANSEPGSESAPPKSSNEIFLYLGDGLESGETGQLSQDEKVKDVGVVVDSTGDKETICDTGVSLNKNGILLTEAILVPDSKIPRRQTSVMFKLDDSNQESSDNEYHSNTAAQQHSNHNDDKSTGDSLRTHGSTVLSAQQSVDTQQTSQLLEETNKASQTPPSNVSKTDGSSAKKLSKSSKKGNRQGNSLVKVLSHHLSDRETSSSYVEDDDVSASNLHRFFNLRKLRGFTGSGNSNRSSKSTASRNRFRREKHMTMMLLSVTAAFLLSWVPPWFIYMTFIYKIPVFSDPILARVAHRHLDRIHLVSFVANPIIYYTFNPTFRTKAKELLRCLCCCCCRKRDAGESQG